MPTDPVKPEITFLTRHYPPNPNINGESVCDMVQYFEEREGVKSNVLCINRGFEGGGGNREPAGHIKRIKTLYQGDHALLRFITFLYDGYVLARKALKFKRTLLICTTSPPLLPLWASLYFKRNIKWALWAFDLFPEGFMATGLVGKGNLFYRWVKKLTYKKPPAFLIALGPGQARHLQQQYKKEVPFYILPCGVLFYQDKSDQVPPWRGENKIYLGYCGNLGDPHNPDLIRAVIDHMDPEKHRLVLALYGNKAAGVKAYAKGKPGIVLVDRVPRDQLHFIDIHLVSLLTEWTHIAVPSKAVSAVSLGCPILFCGSAESDNWLMLQKAGWLIPETSAMEEYVRDFLLTVDQAEIDGKKGAAALVNSDLQRIFLESYKGIASERK
ncbi:MAG TPA: hypothetical protein VFX43_11545 [Chitinophagaceae bacterium]|nr:hypothetical protein [Chitinophagaceae bacterium]